MPISDEFLLKVWRGTQKKKLGLFMFYEIWSFLLYRRVFLGIWALKNACDFSEGGFAI